MQRKPNGWHKTSKATITSHGAEKGHASSKPTPCRCISQVVTPKQSTGGTDATTQASAPKTDKHKPIEDTKHGKA